jgi:hypothetical protein
VKSFKDQVAPAPFVPVEHPWEKKWTKDDYTRHAAELKVIYDDYEVCRAECAAKHIRADELYQIKHGGMIVEGVTESGRHRHETYNLGVHAVNEWKLNKMFNWVEFNRTPEEREESKKRIKELLAKRPKIG